MILKGEGKVTHSGVTYSLCLDFNAICEIEEITGKGIVAFVQPFDDMEKTGQMPAMSDIRTLCLAMLRKHHPDADQRLAGEILTDHMAEVINVMNGAVPNAPVKGASPGKRKAKAGGRS